jgi:hypothetical protein
MSTSACCTPSRSSSSLLEDKKKRKENIRNSRSTNNKNVARSVLEGIRLVDGVLVALLSPLGVVGLEGVGPLEMRVVVVEFDLLLQEHAHHLHQLRLPVRGFGGGRLAEEKEERKERKQKRKRTERTWRLFGGPEARTGAGSSPPGRTGIPPAAS